MFFGQVLEQNSCPAPPLPGETLREAACRDHIRAATL